MRSTMLLSLAAAAAAVVALVLAVVALAGDNGDDSGPALDDIQTRLQELQESLSDTDHSLATTQLIAALDALDGTGTHHFDEQTIQAASLDDVPAGYVADVRKIRAVVESTGWPEDLQDEVQEILAHAGALEEALTGDDLAAMKAASPDFHAAWHALREVGYQEIGGQPPMPEEMHDGMDGM